MLLLCIRKPFQQVSAVPPAFVPWPHTSGPDHALRHRSFQDLSFQKRQGEVFVALHRGEDLSLPLWLHVRQFFRASSSKLALVERCSHIRMKVFGQGLLETLS